ncbi:MAG: M20 family metallo-hydrolase [Synergistaceae bacterium]|nr:M20 family metallo-hydrolase [Synergistaceae bacterium]
MKDDLFRTIEKFEPQMISLLSDLVAIPAISPLGGGNGEYRKAKYLSVRLEEMGFGKAEIYSSQDPKAEEGIRPNLIVRIPGKTSKRLWIVSHMDVVPEGDISLWDTDPFKAVVKGRRIYGRGSSDNCQELVSSLYAAAALRENGLEPEYNVCLCFVADEEVGSVHGIQHLIREGLFSPEDLVIVPDGGNEKGDFIEIAEKSICWIEFTVDGKQVHASRPELGSNACRAANEFSCAIDTALHNAFPDEDKIFEPPVSTFEPTKRNANVPNVNTVPGRDVFCFDCRVLPHIPLEEVLKVIDAEKRKIQERRNVKITYEFLQKEQAPAQTPSDAPVVEILKEAIRDVYGSEPHVGGVGGGTCAKYFRDEGIPAVVWCQEADVAHMPNEYAEIDHMVNEAKVFASMMLRKN